MGIQLDAEYHDDYIMLLENGARVGTLNVKVDRHGSTTVYIILSHSVASDMLSRLWRGDVSISMHKCEEEVNDES